MLALWLRLRRDEGQAMVEYSLIVALISIVAITLIVAVGGDIKDIFENVGSALKSVVP